MAEINKPPTTQYWICHNADGSVMHFGQTESDQVTTTGQPVLNGYDDEEQLNTAIASMDVAMFPMIPNEGELCEYLKVYRYGDDKVKCLQEHTRMHYTPEETPALWLIIPSIASGYPVWVQPTGAHDAYRVGDIVWYPTKDSQLWECTAGDASGYNSWAPGIYGWTKM